MRLVGMNMPFKAGCLILFFLLVAFPLFAQTNDSLEGQLREIIAGRQAQIGVAVIMNGQDTVVVNNGRYPMMSVFKFHQALAVADCLKRKKMPLSATLRIEQGDLLVDTYSPLRDKYPQGGIDISIADLLKYTLQWSDNNACDILFKHVVGVKETDSYLRSLGMEDFSIVATEEDMHRDVRLCYDNWTTPLEAVRLLEVFVTVLAVRDTCHAFVKRLMTECRTGQDRLVAPLLDTEAVIGHKTGTGDVNGQGLLTGVNDMGFVLLPDGQRYTIAVFVKDCAESMESASRIIAELSDRVYKYVAGRGRADK